ncbi:MAG: DEAD/DEAH box helicase family protein [Deltaproteobacteria bacterium]|nr:DEAD/DEAH box helicase family protein [Deltaproteobacteria bacterium]
MTTAVITYDKDLPEIPDRQPHLSPTAYLRKKKDKKDEFEIVEGRRPSKLLLIMKLREAVEKWRTDGYPGASIVSQRLFTYWFEEDHLVGKKTFRYYFGQREAVETLVYLYEVKENRDTKALIKAFAEIFYPEGTQMRISGMGITHQTSMDGKRQIRRYIPEVESETIQDLPAENLRRYAFKMATGSGKTVVMAMVMVWSFFHRKMIQGSDLSRNFLLLAPNVIVYQRLEKDFANNKIFLQDLPLIPPEWKSQWNLKVILRGQSTEPDSSGNLFLTNIQQIYESRQTVWTPSSAIDALLGKKPVKDLASYERPMLERLKGLGDLVVLNDEAHHVHDEDLEWHKTLMALHQALPSGLALWLDFSATPKDQNGTYFPWIICDYPLAQAVEDRIVKAPLIVSQIKRKDPDKVTQKNVIEMYGEWLAAALARWKDHFKTYKSFGQKPVLFIMAEQNNLADEIGEWLLSTKENGLKKGEVLVIHTDKEGEITAKDLEVAREAARDIDLPGNRTKVIVSVLMLREGWDVRNVTVVLGLRPFTSKAKILPEQGVGRGLRLLEGIGPDRTQTLEVMGTKAFEDFVRQLETEGVGIKTVTTPPKPPVKVEPVAEKSEFDIAIPMTKPVYARNYKKLFELDPSILDPAYKLTELDERLRSGVLKLKMEFVTTQTEVHQADIVLGTPPLAQEIIASVVNKVMKEAKLTGVFDDLYPIVRDYLESRCFGEPINLEREEVRSALRDPFLQEGIAKYLARKIGELTAEIRPIEFESKEIKLSETNAFTWRRNLPLLSCDKTIFNLVATYNDFEKQFARFLEKVNDVVRFASLGTTEQESGTTFKVDYLKPSGATGFYYPDWVSVQHTKNGEVNWIIETKGRVWEGTKAKDQAITLWCKRIAEQTGKSWCFLRVNQSEFEAGAWSSLGQLVETIQR